MEGVVVWPRLAFYAFWTWQHCCTWLCFDYARARFVLRLAQLQHDDCGKGATTPSDLVQPVGHHMRLPTPTLLRKRCAKPETEDILNTPIQRKQAARRGLRSVFQCTECRINIQLLIVLPMVDHCDPACVWYAASYSRSQVERLCLTNVVRQYTHSSTLCRMCTALRVPAGQQGCCSGGSGPSAVLIEETGV